MSDTTNLIPQALSHNELIRGEFKPHVFMRWIVLDMDFGALDYKDYQWGELEKLWDMTRKPAQRLLKNLEEAGWLYQEKTRDGVRIYLFPTNEEPEEHLRQIRERVETRRMNSKWGSRAGLKPYRHTYLTDQGNFTRIPYTVLDDQRFSWTDRGVYAVIRSYQNARYGRSIETMAAEINITSTPFKAGLKRWKDAGYVIYDGRRRVVNHYAFNDAPEPEETIREPEETITEPEETITGLQETNRNNKYNNEVETLKNNEPSSEAASYQDQEIPRETKGMALGSTETLRASVSLSGSLVTASARCASAPISSSQGNYAVTQTNPARRRAHNGVVYENKAQRDARVQRALQDKMKRQIARENAQKEETSNG